MPELPDIALYLEALAPRVLGQPLERVRIGESVPAPHRRSADRRASRDARSSGCAGSASASSSRSTADLFLVLHLMIAGRLRWRDRGAAIPGKVGLAAFDFPTGTLRS